LTARAKTCGLIFEKDSEGRVFKKNGNPVGQIFCGLTIGVSLLIILIKAGLLSTAPDFVNNGEIRFRMGVDSIMMKAVDAFMHPDYQINS
jgi:hypothetical protein